MFLMSPCGPEQYASVKVMSSVSPSMVTVTVFESDSASESEFDSVFSSGADASDDSVSSSGVVISAGAVDASAVVSSDSGEDSSVVEQPAMKNSAAAAMAIFRLVCTSLFYNSVLPAQSNNDGWQLRHISRGEAKQPTFCYFAGLAYSNCLLQTNNRLDVGGSEGRRKTAVGSRSNASAVSNGRPEQGTK